jgi:exodeoxyribonuclease III
MRGFTFAMMRIIAWNCNMAFRKKAAVIAACSPDLLVVPECECPDKLLFGLSTPKPKQTLWFGENKNKGLGIFSYCDFKLELLSEYDPKLRTIVPVRVYNNQMSFILFAIWANNPEDKGFQYVGQIWKALAHYRSLLENNIVVLTGDFNSNAIWDKPKRKGNHSAVVQHLMELDIHSCYHKYFNLEQGKEEHSTLFMYRKKDMGYHIDYCFASKFFFDRLQSIEVGRHEDWNEFSDHTPLILDFNIQ